MTQKARAKKDMSPLEAVAARYSVAVTPYLSEIIASGNEQARAQFMPDVRELETTPDELQDPIGDNKHSPVEGLVHRYADRVLLKLVHVCPAYCRFCFRRETVGKAMPMLGPDALTQALDYIRADPTIWEVIMTGGDPLILSPRRIAEVMARFRDIAHVKVIRWHSRVPVVDPSKITDALIAALKSAAQTVYVAVHANHADEFTPLAVAAIDRLVNAGIPLVSQSVLLKGVNDTADALEHLMRRFVELRIKPYYLHHPDLAPGTGHFRLDIEKGQSLAAELRRRASGLCQPHYMLDLPGGVSKVLLTPSHITKTDEGYIVRDIWGEPHHYQG